MQLYLLHEKDQFKYKYQNQAPLLVIETWPGLVIKIDGGFPGPRLIRAYQIPPADTSFLEKSAWEGMLSMQRLNFFD